MRNVTADMLAEFASGHVYPALMAEMFFDSATVGMWTGLGTITWGEKDFFGGGNFIGVSPIAETQDNEAKGITVSLNGIPSSLIASALLEKTRGRPFKLYLGSVLTRAAVATEDTSGVVLTEDGGYVLLENQFVDSPYRIFSGLMDVMEFVDNGETATIRLTVENALIIGQRSKLSRYTSEQQKSLYPNDKGLDMINQLQDKEIVW